MTDLPGGAPELVLIVTGRVSGVKRRIRLWFVILGNRVFVMAGEPRRSEWLRNVQATADVDLEVGGRSWRARATAAHGGPDDPAVRAAFAAKYGTTGLKRWLAESFVVAIDPLQER